MKIGEVDEGLVQVDEIDEADIESGLGVTS